MFGHDSLPSRIYSYGANAPMTNLDLVEKQFHLAHEYRNNLVTVERERRSRVDAALALMAPKLAKVEADLAVAIEELEQAEAKERASKASFFLSAKKSGEAKRTRPMDQTDKRDVRDKRATKKALYATRKEMRDVLFATKKWIKVQEEIDAWATTENKRLRAEIVEAGLYWGTYLAVETSMGKARAGAPPEHKRWSGRGKVSVQLQKGLTIADLLAGGDTRLRLSPKPEGVWVEGTRQPRKLGTAIVHLRVGSTESGKPVFAEVPIHLHRDLPRTAMVKFAWLIRRRIGTHFEWLMQFTMSQESWPKFDAAKKGRVGIDVGWRLMDDPDHEGLKALRVAYWTGSDGSEGELLLPAKQARRGPMAGKWIPWHEGYAKVDELKGLRDDKLNAIKAQVVAWLRGLDTVPAWVLERTKKKRTEDTPAKSAGLTRLAQWKSAGRLAVLVIEWREKRINGDGATYKAAEDWRQQDRHLLSWESHQRDQLQRQRHEVYRVFAAELRRKYATAVIEARSKEEVAAERPMDLRKFHRLPPVDAPADAVGTKGSRAKEHVRNACLSDLRLCLKESMTETETVPAPGTTFTCSDCGTAEKWNQADLMHVCSGCEREWDQDANASRNLLSGMKPRARKQLA
jgi:hypothetical protein